MIQQFRYYRTNSFKYEVVTYHDGIKQVHVEECWGDEALDEYIDKLYEQGYRYAYTKQEVEQEKAKYLRMKALQLIDPTNNKHPCAGCIHWNDGNDCSDRLDDNNYESEEERFLMNCAGCACGDGCECNRGDGCQNYETEEE